MQSCIAVLCTVHPTTALFATYDDYFLYPVAFGIIRQSHFPNFKRVFCVSRGFRGGTAAAAAAAAPTTGHPVMCTPSTEMQLNTLARLRESPMCSRAQVTQPSPRIYLHICMVYKRHREIETTEARGENKGLYVVARNFFLLLLNCSDWPCLGPA